MEVIGNIEKGGIAKCWVDGVELEKEARNQITNIAGMPFIYRHVAVMPDAHAGIGATVGTVIATRGAIIPAAVGVDLGCGMVARKLKGLTASRLPSDLSAVRAQIEECVPVGRTHNGKAANDTGGWRNLPPEMVRTTWKELEPEYNAICEKHPIIAAANSLNHLGTLGTGNHFIELCLDENQDVWLMLHSGSRGVGNRIGSYFIERAKAEMERYFIHLPDKDLAYIPQHTADFEDYCRAVRWAQKFAAYNRSLMMYHAMHAVELALHVELLHGAPEQAINCHHNYVSWERHFGENVIVTRKGAINASKESMGIIPGSMGAKSYIVRGKGHPESFNSCSHGAGRRMSRTEARKRFTVQDHVEATAGVECRKDEGVLDETPAAYKDIDQVMAAQGDLCEIVHTLKAVVCVKG